MKGVTPVVCADAACVRVMDGMGCAMCLPVFKAGEHVGSDASPVPPTHNIPPQTVCPPSSRHCYSESIAFMPHSYFVNDYKQVRVEVG